ncbi:hypothetical protein [Vagococcus lutrae]|uniref:hypothetical protein n=1 Tax=Vagococcus lutrae TaxID=81947 RepID=UPI00288FFCDB|nr:hypothetical protein [Vagococcus lutrae]MDT2807762.1 hypothetical protein [Vagococcus lutrae]
MKTYILPDDLFIKGNKEELIFRKGVLHKNEIIIDMESSSLDFRTYLEKFLSEKEIIISKKDLVFDDFEQLLKLGFIDQKLITDSFLFIVEDELFDFFDQNLDVKVKKQSSILDREAAKILIENKSPEKINSIMDKIDKTIDFTGHLFFMSSIKNINYNKAINIITKKLNIPYTISMVDNENILIANIKNGDTGCFECIEQQIIRNFENSIDSYFNEIDITSIKQINRGENNIVLGVIQKEIQNINTYGKSSLFGNVLHFYLPTYEYNLNTNWIQTTCKTCAGLNNIHFEEQYISSINIIKEINRNV